MPIQRYIAAALILTLAAACSRARADEEQLAAWTQLQGGCDQWLGEGKYREAVAACEKAAAVGERLEPGLFFDTSMNNLVLALLRQERYPEAEQTIRRLLESRSKEFGPEHPLTASGMNLLAALYRKTGRVAEAKLLEAQYQRIQEDCGGQLDDDAKEQISAGSTGNPCDPWPVPDFMR